MPCLHVTNYYSHAASTPVSLHTFTLRLFFILRGTENEMVMKVRNEMKKAVQ